MRCLPFRLSVIMLAVGLLVPLLALPATASDTYESPVDLTFPVAGNTSYTNDYHSSRSRGAHGATDIMANYGLHVHAAVGGRVSMMTGTNNNPPHWGYAIRIEGDDGRTYAYLHLGRQDGPAREAYASGLREGSRVERGQHIGYVGHSGNAHPSAPHLHFEIHDNGVRDRYGDNRRNPYRSLRAAEARGDYPGSVQAATEPGPFDDVPGNHPHVQGIEAIVDGGITAGCSPDGDRYCPERSVTRGQMATFLTRAMQLPDASGHHFDDVPAHYVHADAINAVAEAGIAEGDGNGAYQPQVPVRRDQMATFLARALDLDTSGEPPFDDVKRSSVHAGAIAGVAGEGIAKGNGNGRYFPGRDVSRAQMATFLARAFR